MDGPQKGSDRQRPQVTSALEEWTNNNLFLQGNF
jgi:hypothetical protein